MAHKVVEKQTVNEYQETVAYWEGLISNIKRCSSGGRDAVEAGMTAIRDLEFDAAIQKDKNLRRGDEIGANLARLYQGMQEAYQNVITMFEKPELMVARYDSILKETQKRLDELKQLEQR